MCWQLLVLSKRRWYHDNVVNHFSFTFWTNLLILGSLPLKPGRQLGLLTVCKPLIQMDRYFMNTLIELIIPLTEEIKSN